jgi:hypothetical protein
MRVLEHQVRTFKYGTVNSLEAQSIKDGAASTSLNWQTKGDKIELRRGYRVLGTDAGVGIVTGIRVGRKQDGTEVLFKTYGRKILYFDDTTQDWIENGSNVLPAAADGEEMSLEAYNSLSGAWVFVSSKNSSIYKIATANPGSITDLVMTNHRGRIRIKTGRMYLWDRLDTNKGKDETGLYRSYIDKDEVSDFTAISAEAIGSSGSLTYTGTLAFKAGGAKRTCFLVRFTDTSETFHDDKNGVLVGSAGGTGTINYTTGAYSITFAIAAVGSVTADYYWEDTTAAGIADFSFSATRTAGQGFVLRQDDGGGKFQALASYGESDYCFHEKKAWRFSMSNDDLTATNLIYRDRVGIPNWRAAAEAGEGVYYMDDTDSNDPKFRILTFDSNSAQVVPVPISDNMDLSDFRFDKGATIVFGDWILFACRTSNSVANNRVLVYDRQLRSLDTLEYNVSCFEIYNGALVAGDSLTNNVFELFSGFDDNESNIDNEWEGNLTTLQMEELKKCKRLRLQGEIGPDQSYAVLLSLDNGAFVEVGTVTGTGSYVDRTTAALVGNEVIGKEVVGGGGSGVVAYNYFCELPVRLDKFYQAKIRFEATGLGYISVSGYTFFKILPMGQRMPRQYRQ